MYYFGLFDSLFRANVRYLVCGGMAMRCYGAERFSPDADLILDLTPGNLDVFQRVMCQEGFAPGHTISFSQMVNEAYRTQLMASKQMVAYPFVHRQGTTAGVDVLMDVPIPFQELWEERKVQQYGRLTALVVSIAHLVALKEYANRPQDQQDLARLMALRQKQA